MELRPQQADIPNPDAAMGHELCQWKLSLLSHALWLSCPLSFVTCSSCGLCFSLLANVFYHHGQLLLDRKYGFYILHSCISTIKGLSLSRSSLQILREVLFVHIWVSFQELDEPPAVTGVREGKTMPTLPEITLTEEEEHFSKKMACHFKGPRNMACEGISI